MDGLSIVVPVYNEEGAVLETIEEINSIMCESGIKYEVLLVNDGSTDKTSEILNQNVSKYKFTLIEHKRNMGYGAALKTGIGKSEYEIIAITDADGTYPNHRLPEFFKEIEDYNMIVGKRSFKELPTRTKPAKWIITTLASYLAEFKIPDINSGFRVFWKKDALRFFNIIPNGFSFTTTITLAMLTNNLQIKYIPIDYKKREGKSKIRPIYDTLNFIQLILRTTIYFNPLKIFVPISLTLLFLSLVVFIVSFFFLPRVLDVTTAIIFLSGIQILAIGMLADLIDKRIR